MPIISLNPIEDKRYQEFVATHPNTTVFHSPEWIRILAETYGFKVDCVGILNDKQLTGVIPYLETRSILGSLRAVSLPFSDFCEPLIESSEVMNEALAELINRATLKNLRYIELRGGERILGNVTVGQEILTHDIDLQASEQELFDNLRSNVKRNIRKAEKNGLSIKFETTLASMRCFHGLNCQTRKEHGLPPQPWKFLAKIWQYMINKDNGFVASVYLKDKVIASSIFLFRSARGFYKFGASSKKFQQVRPNDFMLWKSLLYCKERNCLSINLGRTELHHEGLQQFKRGWNGCESRYKYYRYSISTHRFESIESVFFDRVYPAVFSRMPIFMLRPLGALIYRYAN